MRIFVVKLVGFCAVNGIAAAAFMLLLDGSRDAPASETGSVLFRIPRNAHRDVLVLGSSHAMVLSFYKENQAAFEREVGRNCLNLGKGAAGLVPERCYLSYYFDRGNTAGTVLYFIDPWAFHSRVWNEDSGFLEDEPFRPGFLPIALQNRIALRQVLTHMQRKFTPKWIVKGPRHEIRWPRFDGTVDAGEVERRRAWLYPQGTSPVLFGKYASVLEGLIANANQHGARVVLVCPPTLLGTLPGHEEMKALLRSFEDEYEATFHDMSEAISDPGLFRDLDHLNAGGVEVLARAVGLILKSPQDDRDVPHLNRTGN